MPIPYQYNRPVPPQKDRNYHKEIFIRKDQIYASLDAEVLLVVNSRMDKNGQLMPIPSLDNFLVRYKALINKWIDQYLGKAKSRMAAFVVCPEQHGAMNGGREWEEQTIHLSFPWYWNDTTFPNLVIAVDKYIVNSVLFELFSLTLTASDPVTASKMNTAEDAWQDIKHCVVSSKPGTPQKRLKPF